jgi:hypothetical protein
MINHDYIPHHPYPYHKSIQQSTTVNQHASNQHHLKNTRTTGANATYHNNDEELQSALMTELIPGTGAAQGQAQTEIEIVAQDQNNDGAPPTTAYAYGEEILELTRHLITVTFSITVLHDRNGQNNFQLYSMAPTLQ